MKTTVGSFLLLITLFSQPLQAKKPDCNYMVDPEKMKIEKTAYFDASNWVNVPSWSIQDEGARNKAMNKCEDAKFEECIHVRQWKEKSISYARVRGRKYKKTQWMSSNLFTQKVCKNLLYCEERYLNHREVGKKDLEKLNLIIEHYKCRK